MILFPPIFLLASFALSVSGTDVNDVDAYNAGEIQPLHPSSSRSMLRKADGHYADFALMKRSYRDESIPLMEETTSVVGERFLKKDCGKDEKYFRLDIQTDAYGFENKWKLKKRQDNGWAQLEEGPPDGKNYGENKRYIGGYCLSAGDYKFIITDLFKDGMCCTFGNGSYVGYVDGKEEFSNPDGDKDWEKRTHSFTVSISNNNARPPTNKPSPKPNSSVLPFNPKISMSERDSEWLDAHNVRRKEWHEKYGKTYVPLVWSNALENESKVFADMLLEDSCGGLYHDPDNIHGENLASNYGSGSWASVRSADSIVSRWVENEANDPYPANGHLTQVIWRGSKYVGCAEASKPKSGGGMCHVQVCRYARPGNCNMSSYKTNKKTWWVTPVMMDDSPCGPKCPPDGCR